MTPRILAVGELPRGLLPSGKPLAGEPANFNDARRSPGADARPVGRVGDDEPGREVQERFLGPPTGPVQAGGPRVPRSLIEAS